MTSRVFRRLFEQFVGVNYTKSDKTRPINTCKDFSNMERLPSGALRGKEGFKLSAQPVFMEGIHTYEYIDELGNPQNEVLGIGVLNPGVFTDQSARGSMPGSLFKLKSGSFTIVNTGGDSWSMSLLPSDTVDTGFEFKLNKGGVEALSVNLGYGTEASPYTLKQLADAIDGVSSFTCSAPVTAVVNGAQAGVTGTLTVDSGHTVSIGDFVEFTSSATVKAGGPGKELFEATEANATTLKFPPGYNRDFSDNAVLGHGRYPAAILDIFPLTNYSAGDTTTISYEYWEPVYSLVHRNSTRVSSAFSFLEDLWGYSENRKPVFANIGNVCYISSTYATKKALRKIVGDLATNPKSVVREDFNAGVWKYDGKDFYLSGPINQSASLATDAVIFDSTAQGSGSSHGTGTYKYQVSFLKKDARGREIESFQEFIDTHTAASAVDVLLQFALKISTDFSIDWDAFDLRYAKLNGAAAANPITVDADHLLRTGDYVYFLDTSGDTQTAKVTAWTNTTITLDSTHSIADNSIIANCLMRVWRTNANGNEFFLIGEVPVEQDGTKTVVEFTDNIADADAQFNISAVKQTSIQYNFPPVNTIAGHQDLIVVGGGADLPQSIGWEDPLYPESFDKARNIRRIPGVQSGGINCLASHTEASLIIGKCGAVYRAAGSFESAQVDITKVIENSYGAKSTDNIEAIEDILLGVSELGVWTIDKSNQFSTVLGEALLELFRNPKANNQTTVPYQGKRMILSYDFNKQWVHVFLPRETGYNVTGYNSAGLQYIVGDEALQYFVIQLPQVSDQPTIIARWDVEQDFLPSAGFANANGKFYWCSKKYVSENVWTGFLAKRLEDELTLEEHIFTQNAKQYSWQIHSAFDDLNEPEYEKSWYEFIYYQLEPDYFVQAFDVDFISYRDWNEDVSGYTDSDTNRPAGLPFAGAYTKEKRLKFDMGVKAKRRSWKISGSIYKNPPIISGYGYSVSERYGTEKSARLK